MEFRILGPLEVVAEGRLLALETPKLRALLAIMLLHPNEPLSRDQLIDELWRGRPPRTASKILKTYVSQLRATLGRDAIATVGSGYELRAPPETIDLHRFERLVAGARGQRPQAAKQALTEALALWRGPPLQGFTYEPWAGLDIARLDELRLEALQERIEAELTLGHDAELIADLEFLVAQHPLVERLRGQLMVALYRSGRQADALAAYRDARRALVEALGIEPGPELRRLERAVLDQDPRLDVSPLSSPPPTHPQSALRAWTSSFVGRERELREIVELLRRDDTPLLTLTGAAGSGKTRLAVEAAATVDGDPAEPVLVELAPIADPDLVVDAIAARLGVREVPGRTLAEGLAEHLRERRALLLLDNFEQVLAAAPALDELLAGALCVTLLVTSRTPLGSRSERVFSVPPLELPDRTRQGALAQLRCTEAVRLFCDRARDVRPVFELTEANADAVAEVCLRLDGLPLALELAAARSNLLSPRALAERMGSRLGLLAAPPGAAASERHRTLRAAIEWSSDLVAPEQQGLFTSLAVFVGGFTLAAAEAVANGSGTDVLDGVDSLLRNNLLTSERPSDDEPRVGMLETIREYALELLARRGDGEAVCRLHAGYYETLAEEAEAGLLGPDQLTWLARLEAELGNIRAALAWSTTACEPEVGLRIAAPLWRCWNVRNLESEARARLEELLALPGASPPARATGQAAIASLAQVQGDHDAVRRMLDESLPILRLAGKDRCLSLSLGLLGMTALATGDIDEAHALTQEELEQARRTGDPFVQSYALAHVGTVLAVAGRHDEAAEALEEAVRLAESLGNLRSVGGWRMALGGLALLRGEHERADALFGESLAVHRRLGDVWGQSHSLSNLACAALAGDETTTARGLLAECLAFDKASDHYQPGLANDLELVARLAAAGGRTDRAVRMFSAAARVRESVGVHAMEVWWPDPAPHVGELRARLTDVEFEQAWAQGRALTAHAALDEALAETREPEPTRTPGTAA